LQRADGGKNGFQSNPLPHAMTAYGAFGSSAKLERTDMSYAKLYLNVFHFMSPLIAADVDPPLTPREQRMLERIDTLEQRLAAIESRLTPAAPATVAAVSQPQPSPVVPAPDAKPLQTGGFLSDTTFNMTHDGYYAYNFNHPVGQVNLLRAYDVMSNSFSLNQATMVIERAPDVAAGRRFGVRVDLQYGQATETLQGNGQRAASSGVPPGFSSVRHLCLTGGQRAHCGFRKMG
jgi:hypothetical protein